MFHCILRLPNSSTLLFLFFDAKAWPQSQTDFSMCTAVLHCGYTFLRRIDLLHSIACTTVLDLHFGHTFSEPLVKDNLKRLTDLSSTEKPQYRVLQVISHYRYMRVREGYTETSETLHVKWLTYSRGMR